MSGHWTHEGPNDQSGWVDLKCDDKLIGSTYLGTPEMNVARAAAICRAMNEWSGIADALVALWQPLRLPE